MNREQILGVLHDLSLTIGGEVSLDRLLQKTLQRLLFHTGFPAGVVLVDKRDSEFGPSAELAAAVGDYRLAECRSTRLSLPVELLSGKVELLADPLLLGRLSLDQTYSHCLRLPVDQQCVILLLSPLAPATELPLTQIFQPVLANLAKAIVLCRNNEALTARLAADRDDARAELAVTLAQSERERAFLDCLYDAIPDLVWVKDMNGVYLSCNPSFCRLYNASEHAIVGRRDEDFVSPELAGFFRRNDQMAVAAGGPTLNEEWLTFADNGYRGLFETIKTPMRDRDGHLIGVLGISREITERRRIEEALRASEAELAIHRQNLEALVAERTRALAEANMRLAQTQFAMDRVGIGIHWVDCDSGRFVYVNHAAAAMLGYRPDEMLEMSVPDIDPAFPSGDFVARTHDFREQKQVCFDTVNRRRDGSEIPVNVTLYYRPAGSAEPARFITFVRDISDSKRVEQQLREAKDMAESATRAKSDFLANMSHEIRTPMNAIIGSTHLMRRGGLSEMQSVQVQRIEKAGQHLLCVINDILDLSKIEAGKFELDSEVVAPASILAEVAAMLGERAQDKGLVLNVEAADLPASLQGDATRLKQALLNYANNAIKFTSQGAVTLRARVLDEDADGVLLRFEVQDTGIGIEPAVLERLFKPFEQADASTTRQYGGTGLGLAISRHLAELMGGQAGAVSQPGQGSTFWLTARLQRPAMPVAASRQLDISGNAEEALFREFAGSRVLVVEDEPVNRDVAAMLLEDVGLRVELAVDGCEAVERLAAEEYALILMDMQMPRLDGVEATRQIRRLPNGRSLPILALTANVFAEDRERCLAAGMNDFVSKPVDPDQLYITLLSWFRLSQAAQPA
ncbi:MAG: PAS domain S-box protein [Rhodocyclales bacterium GT-UBC]|nr:MAG: PAS domain S-box protein [Rhodocyclales bacterium GT-UBC]